MKILYYHQHFSTPDGSGGTRSYEMAKALVSRGHEVTMICGSYDSGQTGLGIAFVKGRRQGCVDGIQVLEFEVPYSNNDGFLKRVWIFFKFAMRGTRVALSRNYDLLFATTTPLTAGIPGIFAKILRRKPFIFEVRDLWPELPREMGVITNPIILWAMGVLEWLSYRLADACIGLSPGIVEGIAKVGVARDKIVMIPNGCDLELFDPKEAKPHRPEGVSEDDFCAIFTGAHGMANGLDAVLDAARVLKEKERNDIRLIFIGDGKLKPGLEKRAESEKLDNCLFLKPVPKKELTSLMHGCDVGMMILANVPAFYFGTSPNKFFDYIASGMPVLNNYPGWLAGLITEHNCGIAVPPEDPEAFADALISLADDRNRTRRMGKNSRALAEAKFNRSDLAESFCDWLEKLSGYDYDAIADLHINNLDKSFLASLGHAFLALMYRCIDESNNSFLSVYKVNGRIAGFVTGTVGFGEIYKIMLKHHLAKLFIVLLPNLFSPLKFVKILEILLYSKKHGRTSNGQPAAELLSIAVDQDFRGKGIADTLYYDLCSLFQGRGVNSFKIVVGESLAPAHSFYTRMGAKTVNDIKVHKGDISVVYVQELRLSKVIGRLAF